MKYSKEEEKQLTLLLRYGELKPRQFKYRRLSLHQIARHLNRSITHVRDICKTYQREFEAERSGLKVMTRRMKRLVLAEKPYSKRPTPAMIEYLTDPEVVRQWSHMTLSERQQMLHRRFPEQRLSIYYLRCVYRNYKISKKKIRKTKIINQHQQARIREECR